MVRRNFAAIDIGELYATDDDPEADFSDVDSADAAADFDTFAIEVDLARKAAAGRSLDETFVSLRRRNTMSLRWVYVHMIEEYARHNGHADLIRERIDGVTGD